MQFQPDYRHMLSVMQNKRPERLPLYEHLINTPVMENILGFKFADLLLGNQQDQQAFFEHYCRFYKDMTYDTVSFEVCVSDMIPDHGAIYGGRPGPVQTRDDFNKFPWQEIPVRFWQKAHLQFRMLGTCLPKGMKVVGGIGNGVFEICEELVGFEYLCLMQAEDPDLFSDIFRKAGDLLLTLWKEFLQQYTDYFVVCRIGDDLGYKSGTLLAPHTIREHIIPQYKRIIKLIHTHNVPFLLHSCGNIFTVMDDLIFAGIDGKHSNEDIIAPFDHWIDTYGDRIALLGGIDVDLLCQKNPPEIFDYIVSQGMFYRERARGYALGSGNSIPEFVPIEGYLALISAAKRIRALVAKM
jgi:uroporphyrinogen decarboxylase